MVVACIQQTERVKCGVEYVCFYSSHETIMLYSQVTCYLNFILSDWCYLAKIATSRLWVQQNKLSA